MPTSYQIAVPKRSRPSGKGWPEIWVDTRLRPSVAFAIPVMLDPAGGFTHLVDTRGNLVTPESTDWPEAVREIDVRPQAQGGEWRFTFLVDALWQSTAVPNTLFVMVFTPPDKSTYSVTVSPTPPPASSMLDLLVAHIRTQCPGGPVDPLMAGHLLRRPG